MNALTPTRQCAVAKVAALGIVEASPELLADLRKNPGNWSAGGEPPASHLKLVDEQAVLGTVAVLALSTGPAGKIGLLPSGRWLLRRGFWAGCGELRAFGALLNLGPRSLSPIHIPTLSLHSISGVISLILQSRGSNFGAGGDCAHVSEALLTGLAIQHGSKLPGVWVILTGWEPESIPDDNGRSTNPILGYGIAMALVDESSTEPGIRLQYDPTPVHNAFVPISIGDLAGKLRDPQTMDAWNCRVKGGGIITLLRSVQSFAA